LKQPIDLVIIYVMYSVMGKFVFGLLLVVALSTGLLIADPVLDFYVRQAAEAIDRSDSLINLTEYRLTMRQNRYQFSNTKGYRLTDSSSHRLFFTGHHLDSARSLSDDEKPAPEWPGAVANIFDQGYQYNFFPNDTGGKFLAIGFDTESAGDSSPIGLAIIDRNTYYPHWLYQYYSGRPSHNRLSRRLHLVYHDGLIIADTIVEIGSESGVFFNEVYRRETFTSDFTLTP
jgi:hypothetical protein